MNKISKFWYSQVMLRKEILNHFKTSNSLLLDDLQTGTSLTYKSAYPIIRNLICKLEKYDIKPGDKIAVVMENSMNFVLLYIACLIQRIIICPINPQYQIDDIQYCLNLCQAKKIIIDSTTQIMGIPTIPESSLFSDGNYSENDSSSTVLHCDDYHPDDLYSITFTSGTTGKPKAIGHKAETHLKNADAFNTFVGNDQHQRMLHVMPMFYMAGILNTLLCPLQAGGCIVIGSSFGPLSPVTFWKSFLDNNCTTTWLSPTMIHSIIKLDRNEKLKSEVRTRADELRIFSGTAPLTENIKREFYKKYRINLLQSYGLSETLLVSVKNVGKIDFNSSVGTILDGITVSFAEDGEILLNTDYIMEGYLNAQSEFEVENERLFSTGDLGAITNGELYITGRKKDLIIKGGVNIDPIQIERVILQLNFIDTVAVVGYEHEFYGEDIALFVVPFRDIDEVQAELVIRNHCREQLSASLIPSKIIFLNELPLTPTGKIQKSKLRIALP